MKMMWRQRRTVLIYITVDGEKRDEEKESSQMKPRMTRTMTVKIKLRKYNNLTPTFRIRNVIKNITTSFTIWITRGKINVNESSGLHEVMLGRDAGCDSMDSFTLESVLSSS